MRRVASLALALLAMFLSACHLRGPNTIVIGSKNFTEQAILGELLAQEVEARTKLQAERRFYLSGTYICQQAILAGRIDAYVEYTGTALSAILKEPLERDPQGVFKKVRQEYWRRFALQVEPPLGFDNTFALVIRGEDARKDNVQTISAAAAYAPRWRAGFGYEFMERPDGYEGLVHTYNLKFAAPPRIMDLGLLYRALLDKQVDLVAGNSTDGLLIARDLTILQDDRHYFPPYEAVAIVRRDALMRHPELAAVFALLAGKISDQEMRRLNYAVDGEHRDSAAVVREFLASKGLLGGAPRQSSRAQSQR